MRGRAVAGLCVSAIAVGAIAFGTGVSGALWTQEVAVFGPTAVLTWTGPTPTAEPPVSTGTAVCENFDPDEGDYHITIYWPLLASIQPLESTYTEYLLVDGVRYPLSSDNTSGYHPRYNISNVTIAATGWRATEPLTPAYVVVSDANGVDLDSARITIGQRFNDPVIVACAP
ncbi:hypothetical protein [Xylanimonas ulmi]|uniref:Uncharacterized protein n=1 Tax=Xylanimonas ulmi TaxID=228973 RepID=A0A4Q7M497_9MICO|nr:hypothetical protein [Xylanibacterium ulmi]RZS60809.1 hypothetical protein EV386_1089 [Xylanibacterium ulmi]